MPEPLDPLSKPPFIEPPEAVLPEFMLPPEAVLPEFMLPPDPVVLLDPLLIEPADPADPVSVVLVPVDPCPVGPVSLEPVPCANATEPSSAADAAAAINIFLCIFATPFVRLLK